MNSGGIGGGAKSEVKIPRPTERCGEGAYIVGGGGLWLRSSVSTSESEVLLCVDLERPLPRTCFSVVYRERRVGEGPRDAVGVAKGSLGKR